MATYTIELGALLRTGYDIGLEDYPVPSFVPYEQAPTWRHALNQKIVDHYLYNEICCTPPDRFKHFLNTTMREQMPYYNKLYEALNQRWNFTTGTTLTEIISDSTTDNKTTTDDGRDNRVIHYGQVDQTVVDTDTTHTNTIVDDGGHTLNSTKNEVGTKNSNEGIVQDTDSNKDTTGTEDATTDTTGHKVIDTDTTNTSNETKNTTFTGSVTTTTTNLDVISDTPGSPLNVTGIIDSGYASNAKRTTGLTEEVTVNNETVTDNITASGTVDTTEDTTGKEVLDRDTTGNEKFTENVVKDTVYSEKTTDDTTYGEQGKTWNQNDDNGSTTLDTVTDYKTNQETKNYGTDYNRRDEKGDSTYSRSRMLTGIEGQAYIDLFDKYVRLMRNIDLEVIAALSSCFMGIL